MQVTAGLMPWIWSRPTLKVRTTGVGADSARGFSLLAVQLLGCVQCIGTAMMVARAGTIFCTAAMWIPPVKAAGDGVPVAKDCFWREAEVSACVRLAERTRCKDLAITPSYPNRAALLPIRLAKYGKGRRGKVG